MTFRLSCGAGFEALAFVFASGVALHLLHFCYGTARGTLQKRGISRIFTGLVLQVPN